MTWLNAYAARNPRRVMEIKAKKEARNMQRASREERLAQLKDTVLEHGLGYRFL
ncbi:MAG: hypothetical protein GX322_01860 [Firmicutes bacterium]|nr:hypothetical protein [Bacillota bacterium]